MVATNKGFEMPLNALGKYPRGRGFIKLKQRYARLPCMFMRAFSNANSHLTLVSLSGAKVHYSTKQIQDLGDGVSSVSFLKQRQQIDSKESTTFDILTVITCGPAAMEVKKNVCTCRIWHRPNWKGHELSATSLLHIDGMLPRGRYTSSNEWDLGKPSITKCRICFSPILADRSDSVERTVVRAEGE